MLNIRIFIKVQNSIGDARIMGCACPYGKGFKINMYFDFLFKSQTPIVMQIVLNVLIGIIALMHLYFMYFEMFAWNTTGRSIFKSVPKEAFKYTTKMAANQGLYNGFLAAGLIWSFFVTDVYWQENLRYFFLSCVALAGMYGANSISSKIFYVQALPALVALCFMLLQAYV